MGNGRRPLEDLVAVDVLVTGNLGYVGPGVVRRLRGLHPAARLTGYDAGFFAHCLTGVTAPPDRHLDRQWLGDVRDMDAAALEDIEGVVHLAAISNDPIGDRYRDATLAINHRATVETARRAKAAGVRAFAFASSCSVYGSADGTVTEDSPVRPLTAYAESKARAEEELAVLADDEFIVTCLRFATACGMSDRLRLDLVLNDFVASALSTGAITVLSDGTPWRPLIHVDDMARAVAWALGRTGAEGGPFLAVNVGADQGNHRIADLADAVAAVIPGVAVAIGPDAAPDRRSYRVGFARYREFAPEHQPQFDLNATVRGLVDGMRRMAFADPAFRSSHLVRLVTLESLRGFGLLDDDLRWRRMGDRVAVPGPA